MKYNSQRGPVPSELAWLIDELNDLADRVKVLEAPSGESLSSTVAKLQALVTDIQAQLDAWVAGRWTNAEITTQINATIASYTGNASISGTLGVGGTATVGALITSGAAQIGANASVAGTLTGNGPTQLNDTLRVPDAYNFDITYTRRSGWWGNDGRAGYASSSLRKKTSIKPADATRLLAILDAVPVTFRYRAEIRRRTSRRINEGVDYVPPIELGLIAEELDRLGLHEFVYYDDEGRPEGIEYAMLVVALLAVARDHERRLARIEAALGDRLTP